MTTPTENEIAMASSKARWWQIARMSIGVLLCVAGVLAALNGIMGAAAGAYVADGGAPNGARGLLIMGLCLAGAIGLVVPIWWTFSGRSEDKYNASSGIVVAVLSLIGAVLGHNSAAAAAQVETRAS